MTKSVQPLEAHFSTLKVMSEAMFVDARFKQDFRVPIPIKWEASLVFLLLNPCTSPCNGNQLVALTVKVMSLVSVLSVSFIWLSNEMTHIECFIVLGYVGFFTSSLLHIFILDKQINLDPLFLDDTLPPSILVHGDVHGVSFLGKCDGGILVEVYVHHAGQHIVGEVQGNNLLVTSLKLFVKT